MVNQRNQVKIYPIPRGAVLQEDYCIRIRPLGAEHWQEVRAYRVKVDMHDVRQASMAFFDFSGKVEVEITFPRIFTVYKVDIRPLFLGIRAYFDADSIRFVLDKPSNLSIEVNKDRFHNLHLFTNIIEETPDKNGENVLLVKGSLERVGFLTDEVNRKLEKMPKGRTVYVEAGLYYLGEYVWRLPSDTNIYLEGGVVLIGGMAFENGENLHISGRGILYLADLHRFSGIHGIRLNHSRNINIENVIFINPPHYTVNIGTCENVVLRNLKSFSCEGWSDGIDMMSSHNVLIDGGFLRTSDDCVAIYGSRWDNRGGSSHIRVQNLTLWADVAHPMNIGTHGDYEHDGDVIEDILFENIDVLEHHEYQSGYLGVMAINPGDKNLVCNVTYRNIRIEPFEHGKVLDFQVKWNPDYNPAPGKGIRNIRLDGVYVISGQGEESSEIAGYSEEFCVEGVSIQNFYRDGKQMHSLEDANIRIGKYVKNVMLEQKKRGEG